MKDTKSKELNEVEVITRRLQNRRQLMEEASNIGLSEGAGVILQTRASEAGIENDKKSFNAGPSDRPTAKDICDAVNYRLAITDLFVEKAQYHLESRAKRYRNLGFVMYALAVSIFAAGAALAVWRMLESDQVMRAAQAAVTPPTLVMEYSTQAWIDFLRRFVLAFTGYGFIVLTAVALVRGARACLDQRERLLTKRHSLRQGRLYLHLTGGHVTIDEMERAFNWNHEQYNAFTNMPTDTKAPWGSVVEEIVKITPELVKAGVTVAREASEKRSKEGEKPK